MPILERGLDMPYVEKKKWKRANRTGRRAVVSVNNKSVKYPNIEFS